MNLTDLFNLSILNESIYLIQLNFSSMAIYLILLILNELILLILIDF